MDKPFEASGSPHAPLRLQVAVLSNKNWEIDRASALDGHAPDPDRLRQLLARRGIDLISVEMFGWPLNPWARSHPVYAGIDPLRALLVLGRYRSADLIIGVFESCALLLLMLRRLALFKPHVVLWDSSVGSTWRTKRWIMGRVLPRIDHVFALTRWQADALAAQHNLTAPVGVVGYAVDETFYHPRFNRNPSYVLSVGEDDARDYATVVEAVRTISTRVILKTRRSIDIPPEAATRIRREAAFLSAVQLRDLYAGASLFVLPLKLSYNPSGITSLFEAMAMGKAIVASDVPMVRELVTHGVSALLVPVGDVQAMRQACLRLLTDSDLRRGLGNGARARLEGSYGMEAFAERFAAGIKRATHARSSRRQHHRR
jgi:glycosyltransferase involved in cell wall biosynthesis